MPGKDIANQINQTQCPWQAMRSELTNRAGDEGRKRRRKPAANGFTLIELLVVIGVIAILAALSG